MKNKIKFTIPILIIFLIAISILLVLKYIEDKNDELSSNEDVSSLKRDCSDKINKKKFIGSWMSKSNQIEDFRLNLVDDNFELINWGNDSKSEGLWNLSDNPQSIELVFDSLSPYWDGFLSRDDLEEKFPSIIDYSYIEKRIDFRVSYADLTIATSEKCEFKNLYIDFLNYALYRE